ncbi:MAG TPA: hypothetical protein VGS07_18450 [Thermoanaerobaculia bacterium]|jgi:hypothetical protein|nr:hypothetical protein [Thermoanaerobaculia bacterium]
MAITPAPIRNRQWSAELARDSRPFRQLSPEERRDTLVTSDYHEMDALAQARVCPIRFIR